ncbi:hypothetical protein GCM10009675_34830 [Prauserella alba]|uniref:Uncharacterized protein n=1 Tax=Prauserella alba TaxID=176898 RepID=A0ABP4G2I2_9PSEU
MTSAAFTPAALAMSRTGVRAYPRSRNSRVAAARIASLVAAPDPRSDMRASLGVGHPVRLGTRSHHV